MRYCVKTALLVAGLVTATASLEALQPNGFSLIGKAHALDNASLENLSFRSGFATYIIKKMDIAGSALSTADTAALFDAASTVPVSERLAKLTAQSITIPEMTAEQKLAGNTSTIIYKNVVFTDVVSGKAASATINSASLSSSGGPAGSISGTYGQMNAKNIDLAQMAHISSDLRKDENEAIKPVYDSFTIDGLSLKGGNSQAPMTIQTGAISMSGVKARALSVSYADLGTLVAKEHGKTEPTPEQMKMISSLLTDIGNGFEIGSMEMRDLVMSSRMPDNSDMKFALPRFAVTGLAQGKMAEMALEGLDIDTKDAKIRFGQFALRNLDAKAALSLLATSMAKGKSALDALDPRDFAPSLGQIVLANLYFDVKNDKKQGNSAGGERDVFQIGRIEMNASNYISAIPTTSSVVVDHVMMDLPDLKNNKDFKDFAELGYSRIDLSSRMGLVWNEGAKEIALKDVTISGSDMGAIKLSAIIGNAERDLFSPNPSLVQAAALALVVKKVDVRLDNSGLFEKAIAAQAKKTGKKPEAIKEELITTAAIGIPAALNNAPAAKLIGNAVAKFLADPKNVHITATSKDGLGMSDMGMIGQPDQLLNKLDVTAVANE